MKKPDLKDLTLREKIGQTAVFRHLLLGEITDIADYFTKNPIGATWPLEHPREVYKVIETELGNPELKGRKDNLNIDYTNTINKYMRIPVIPVMDAANGVNPNIYEDHAELPNFTSLGATDNPEYAYRYGKCIGEDFKSIGYKWIWSPVADNKGVFSGLRSATSNIENNCKILAAFIKGVQDAGVATGAKHFPGADPYEYRDSHFCSASYSQSYEYWEKTQMREFQACIDAGVDSIMVGHKTFKAVDDTRVNGALLPCTLSHKVVTGLIKEKMGFKGVVLTDDADMKALRTMYPPEKLYVEILRAGIDMVLGPEILNYVDVIEEAVLSGDLPESRIDDACQRVLNMKEKYGLFDQGEIPYPTEEKRQEIKDSINALSKDVAEHGMTLCANHTNFLPVKKENIKKVKIVYIGYCEIEGNDYCFENLKHAAEEFKRHGAECDIQFGFEKKDNETLNQYDLIIYATHIGFHAPVGAQRFVLKECHTLRQIMIECTEKSIGVSFGNPDIYFNYFTAAHTFINTYSYTPETMVAFVKGLYGEVEFTDYSPFPLNPITRTNEVFE